MRRSNPQRWRLIEPATAWFWESCVHQGMLTYMYSTLINARNELKSCIVTWVYPMRDLADEMSWNKKNKTKATRKYWLHVYMAFQWKLHAAVQGTEVTLLRVWGIHSFHWKQHYIRILVQKFTIFLRKYYLEVSCNLNALYHGMSFTIYHSAHRYILSFPAHNECKSLSCDQKHLTNIWTILTLLSKGHTICFQRKKRTNRNKNQKGVINMSQNGGF